MNLELRLIELQGKEIMLKESETWLCWPIIMRDKNPIAGCFHIGIKIGVSKDYREKFAKQLLYQRDTNRLQQNTRRLQTNAQNQVNRMLVIIARKQTRIGE